MPWLLDWLGTLTPEGRSELRVEERRAALTRRTVGQTLVTAGSIGALTVLVVAPPTAVVLLPVLAAQVGIQGVGLGVFVDAEHDLDRRELAEQVELLPIGTVAAGP